MNSAIEDTLNSMVRNIKMVHSRLFHPARKNKKVKLEFSFKKVLKFKKFQNKW